ncbi:transcriptional regulator, partial [Escherichia coli]|nr:transcriptional regulator [Escherichia coli]
LKLLLDYAQAYNSGNVSDDQASKLIERVDDLQEDRLELRDKYVKRIAKNVSPKRAMRFLQIEIQLDAIATLEIGRQVPLVE